MARKAAVSPSAPSIITHTPSLHTHARTHARTHAHTHTHTHTRTRVLVGIGKGEVSEQAAQSALKNPMILERSLHEHRGRGG